MLPFEEKVYVDKVPHDATLLLGADIGGTNSNFGFFKKDHNTLTLIFSLHIKSQTITDFAQTVKDLLDYVARTYGISVRRSSFAAAGVVSEAHDYCKPTNLSWAIDSKEILWTQSAESKKFGQN
jgi:glucokinase